MKNLSLLVVFLLLVQALSAKVSVTFNVNLTTAAGFNPVVHQVYISGARQDASAGFGSFGVWPMPGIEPGFKMQPTENPMIYTLTLSNISPNSYAYKYFLVENNNPTWALGEWHGDPNRLLVVGPTNVVLKNTFGQITDIVGAKIVINEMLASNSAINADEDGNFEDWIEIYNEGGSAVNLRGYKLTDNLSIPDKWTFPETSIFPGQYLVIWASGKDRAQPGQPLHTNFRISADGEPVIFSSPDGEIIDQVDEVRHQTNISWGRLPNGTETFSYLTQPTPGYANEGPGYTSLLQPLEFSHTDGYYSTGFNLTITSPDAGTTIRYTLDGSEPTQDSPVYTIPITIAARNGQSNTISMIPTNNNSQTGPPYFEGWQPPVGEVFKINVVRAKAFHPTAPPERVYTASYIVNNKAAARYTLPVFSLATDNKNLFDDETGIYVHGNHQNYFQDEWERPAHLTLLTKAGDVAFKEDLGIRLHGNTTRSRPRKSFRIVMRGEYGSSWLNYQLFPDKKTDMYKRFILRNSGNDWDFTIFRDGVFQYLAKNLNVETQYYQPAILFINGEYWGIHNIRDKYDDRYIFAKYGIEENEMTILSDNSAYRWGNEQGKAHYDNMVNFIRNNNLANTSNYNQVKERMDVESFIDFQLTHIFVKNTDWPGNNVLYWRYNREGFSPANGVRDGRWRWMILDTDFGFDLPFTYVPGLGEGPSHNTLAFATAPSGPFWPNPEWSTLMLRKLLENTEFRNKFINRYCDLLNTTFRQAHVISAIDSIAGLLAPEMEEHINRWRRPASIQVWNDNVQVLRTFARQRPASQFQHMQQKFGLSGTSTLTVDVSAASHGYVTVNTIDVRPATMGVSKNPYPWSGTYFRGVPMQLEAKPLPGYMFSRWSGGSAATTPAISLSMAGNTQLTAHFVKAPEPDLIHFWFIGNTIVNDTPLEWVDPTYTINTGARLNYKSALAGYPFASGDPNWRKASMERRNSPTEINYQPLGNNGVAFAHAAMRGLQVKQPFSGDGGENTLYFVAPTQGFKDVKFQFAAKDEGAASGLIIDYSVTETPVWITTGLTTNSFPLTNDYQLFTVDYTGIATVSGNPHFRIRLRFNTTNPTADNGNRVTFNNFSIAGFPLSSTVENAADLTSRLMVFPNPAGDHITIEGTKQWVTISIIDMTGRLVINTNQRNVDVSPLQKGVYLVRAADASGSISTARFVKR